MLEALQKALLAHLRASAAVTALVGARIYDNVPEGVQFPFISFGSVDFTLDDVECVDGRRITTQIDIWSNKLGSIEVKRIVDAVIAQLRIDMTIEDPYAIGVQYLELTRILDDPDPGIRHGVVQVTVKVEE